MFSQVELVLFGHVLTEHPYEPPGDGFADTLAAIESGQPGCQIAELTAVLRP